MIEISRVSKKYGKTLVLDEVSLTIPQGGLTAVIGPNGAGKSTLLSLASRLSPMDSGRITVDRLDVSTTSGSELAKKLSILRQENSLTMRLTVRELVTLGRFPHCQGRPTTTDLAAVEESLRFLHLEEFAHRYLDQLSGGQRQRAFVAMVLCQDTDYVLLDEPLNNLDMRHAAEMMKLLKRIVGEKKKTVVIVVHDINFASVYSDHIVAMKDGRLHTQGSPETIMTEEILESIYDFKIPIHESGGHRIANYYGKSSDGDI